MEHSLNSAPILSESLERVLQRKQTFLASSKDKEFTTLKVDNTLSLFTLARKVVENIKA